MTVEPSSAALPRDEVAPEDCDVDGRYLYPGEVEDAMPEGHLAWWLGVYLVQAIFRLVADPRTASAHANMPIYYAKGEPRRHVSPDALYLPGVPMDQRRRSYCLWKTGVVPQVVFEVISRHHEHKDEVENRARYQDLGIPEYYWFDPERTLLVALRLDSKTGRYRKARANQAGRYRSPALGLDVGLEGDLLGLFHEGRYVEPTEDVLARLQDVVLETEARLAKERARRLELEAELRALRERDS